MFWRFERHKEISMVLTAMVAICRKKKTCLVSFSQPMKHLGSLP